MISRGKYACYCNILLLSRFLQHHFVPVFLIPGNSYNILKQFFFFFFLYLLHAECVFLRTIWNHKSTKCHLHKEFCSYSITPINTPPPTCWTAPNTSAREDTLALACSSTVMCLWIFNSSSRTCVSTQIWFSCWNMHI